MSHLPHVGAGPLRSAADVARFALAGNAILTVSSRSGARYTFKIAAPHKRNQAPDPAEPARFVDLLTGPDNRQDYTYLGLIPNVAAPAFRLTRKSRLGVDAAPVRAAAFLCSRVLAHPEAPLPDGLEVRHEGRCGKCGRALTVPESIDRGIGPECWAKLGG